MREKSELNYKIRVTIIALTIIRLGTATIRLGTATNQVVTTIAQLKSVQLATTSLRTYLKLLTAVNTIFRVRDNYV